MDDKNLMENILLLEKGVCDLYMHGTIEASTDNVHQAFSSALNEALCMQDTIYDEMAAKGWYPDGAGRSEQDQFFEAEVQYAGDAVTKEISFPAPALK